MGEQTLKGLFLDDKFVSVSVLEGWSCWLFSYTLVVDRVCSISGTSGSLFCFELFRDKKEVNVLFTRPLICFYAFLVLLPKVHRKQDVALDSIACGL